MDVPMKPQPGMSINETNSPAPHSNPATHIASSPHTDPVPRLVRYAQILLAVVIVALCIAALVGFEHLLSSYGLVGGSAYVAALVISIIVAVYTVTIVCLKPIPARLIAEYVAIPLWILAAAFLAGESAVVMNSNCLYCIYIFGSGPNSGAAAAGLGGLEL
ncbi:MAG: hypothetical protein M1830_009833 [Pleopsidium flavum]|nr:MAG: hypothetical protein M1830_009833 [Pleopsidium flavum]